MLVVSIQIGGSANVITDFVYASSWHSLIKALESQGIHLARGRRRLNMKIYILSGQYRLRPSFHRNKDIRSSTSLAVSIPAAHATALLCICQQRPHRGSGLRCLPLGRWRRAANYH
jgi:hypothetical protein